MPSEAITPTSIRGTQAKRSYLEAVYRENPCAVCGKVDGRKMARQIVSGKEQRPLSTLISGTASLLNVIEYLNRSVVLCAGCHGTSRTHPELVEGLQPLELRLDAYGGLSAKPRPAGTGSITAVPFEFLSPREWMERALEVLGDDNQRWDEKLSLLTKQQRRLLLDYEVQARGEAERCSDEDFTEWEAEFQQRLRDRADNAAEPSGI